MFWPDGCANVFMVGEVAVAGQCNKIMKNVQETRKSEISFGPYPVSTWGGTFLEMFYVLLFGVQNRLGAFIKFTQQAIAFHMFLLDACTIVLIAGEVAVAC